MRLDGCTCGHLNGAHNVEVNDFSVGPRPAWKCELCSCGVYERPGAEEIEAHRSRPRGLHHWTDKLIEAANEAQCSCSVSERLSGHLVDCWMPALREALDGLEAAKRHMRSLG